MLKIIEEIDFQIANISYSESSFVNTILDLLSDGEMNQSEIMKYLKQISFLSKYSIGEKKVLSLLDKWSKMGKWSYEQRVNEKNAKFYYIQTAKLAKHAALNATYGDHFVKLDIPDHKEYKKVMKVMTGYYI